MFSSACHRGTFSPAVGGTFNMLTNPGFSGALAGSPGTVPGGWSDAVGATGSLALPAKGLTFTALTGFREFIGQQRTLLPNTTYTFSFNVLAVSGGLAADNIAQVIVGSGSATFPDGSGLGSVSATLAIAGRNRFRIVTGVAGAVVTIRLGVGCGNILGADCSVTIADPVLNWRPN